MEIAGTSRARAWPGPMNTKNHRQQVYSRCKLLNGFIMTTRVQLSVYLIFIIAEVFPVARQACFLMVPTLSFFFFLLIPSHSDKLPAKYVTSPPEACIVRATRTACKLRRGGARRPDVKCRLNHSASKFEFKARGGSPIGNILPGRWQDYGDYVIFIRDTWKSPARHEIENGSVIYIPRVYIILICNRNRH